jgi:predicted N-acetyltransferase YhbS
MRSNHAHDFPLEVIDESLMPLALDSAIRELLCTCFPADKNVFQITRHWHGSAPAFSILHQQGDQVCGHIGVVVRTVRVDSREVIVAGVQNFAVHPAFRGSGLGSKLMNEAMAEARRRGIGFGLLFCLPALEKYYCSMGWFTVGEPATMADERGNVVPTPEKNICMATRLTPAPFPPGRINLQGRDW